MKIIWEHVESGNVSLIKYFSVQRSMNGGKTNNTSDAKTRKLHGSGYFPREFFFNPHPPYVRFIIPQMLR